MLFNFANLAPTCKSAHCGTVYVSLLLYATRACPHHNLDVQSLQSP